MHVLYMAKRGPFLWVQEKVPGRQSTLPSVTRKPGVSPPAPRFRPHASAVPSVTAYDEQPSDYTVGFSLLSDLMGKSRILGGLKKKSPLLPRSFQKLLFLWGL